MKSSQTSNQQRKHDVVCCSCYSWTFIPSTVDVQRSKYEKMVDLLGLQGLIMKAPNLPKPRHIQYAFEVALQMDL